MILRVSQVCRVCPCQARPVGSSPTRSIAQSAELLFRRKESAKMHYHIWCSEDKVYVRLRFGRIILTFELPPP
jgi:hypothetical protein